MFGGNLEVSGLFFSNYLVDENPKLHGNTGKYVKLILECDEKL